MKVFKWLSDNILFVCTLFLLAFIPLYPKLPLVDVKNTWVYIRAEDFIAVLVLSMWGILLLRRKITLKTPLTMSIFLFWLVGALATIHAVLLIFPYTADVFPNVAFLSFLRRVEYISMFFIAFTGIKDKRFLSYVITILLLTLLGVIFYGFGQKYLGFPAFLTMNEEFAKGEPIRLSALSRVPSTFAGHYDLAAYLVLILPILSSLIFGIRNWFMKAFLAVTICFGIVLLFMTVSRVSFFVLFIALGFVLFLQKKKLFFLSIPFVILGALFILSFTPALVDRFSNTVKEIDVLVDAKTGEVIGHASIVPFADFENRALRHRIFQNKDSFENVLLEEKDGRLPATESAVIDYEDIPRTVAHVMPPNAPTGENLPQGTGYINLHLSPVTKRLRAFVYENPVVQTAGSDAAYLFVGNFLVKRAAAYDLSFTTRFQGEWPNALEAFGRNVFLGSGYGSISLAIDNNYLRILGEIGLLGFAAFVGIFVATGIYIRKIFPHVDSPLVRSFVFGFIAGVIGLALNATLIDVFEASKIAFLLWLLTGVTLGTLHLYQKTPVNMYKELLKAATSPVAIILYLCIFAVTVFSPMVQNYFVGDDFTWFRWVADCSGTVCPSPVERITSYFTQSDGFFYRPGTKTFFLGMYSLFWLNQTVYHIVSLSIHAIVAVLVFLLARKILHDVRLAALSGFLFLILSGYTEAVFWISAIGHLFTFCLMLASLLFFIAWHEKKHTLYFIASFITLTLSLLFHEAGIVTPLLFLLYLFTKDESFSLKRFFRNAQHWIYLMPVAGYLVLRFLSQSHWSGGDYSYNLLKLPFNVIGNALGYFVLTVLGPISLPGYQALRIMSKENIVFGIVLTLAALGAGVLLYRFFIRKLQKDEKKTIIFCTLFFIITLLPFLGLGNITSRYSYLSAVGVIMLLAFLLKKFYYSLLTNGREIALSSIGIMLSVFALFHVIQVQQIHSDWYEAGKKVQRFFVAIDESYQDEWAGKSMKFHFVNVPVRMGEAWVFTIALPDALWLTFRNPNIHVYSWQTLEEAYNAVPYGDPTQKIFEFDDSGSVTERVRPRNLQ